MKISTRGRYGTRLVLNLAMNYGKGPLQLKNIAREQDISLNYIEHLIGPLVAAGIVRTARGASGGAWLAKPPRDIKVSDVVSLFEGSTAPVECVDNPGVCKRSTFCVTRDIWKEVKEAVNNVFESMSFQELVEKQNVKRKPEKGMYYI